MKTYYRKNVAYEVSRNRKMIHMMKCGSSVGENNIGAWVLDMIEIAGKKPEKHCENQHFSFTTSKEIF